MSFSIKKDVQLPKPSNDVMNYIKSHHLSTEAVAQNLVDTRHPDGFHGQWLRKLIRRGLSNTDKKAVKIVVDKLSNQLRGKNYAK